MKMITIYTDGLEECIRCILCKNKMKTERGCDGGCNVDDSIAKKICDEISSRIENKYRWHNIRKNPNDLPRDSFRYVLVKVVHRYSESDGYYDYDMGFIHSDGVEQKWVFKSSKNTEIYRVVAWKEIEQFEEEV